MQQADAGSLFCVCFRDAHIACVICVEGKIPLAVINICQVSKYQCATQAVSIRNAIQTQHIFGILKLY